MTSTKTVLVHKNFKMGTAPYRYVGLWSHPSKGIQEVNPEAYNRLASARPACCKYECDHCGMPITNHYMIKDANGTAFSVGEKCVEKLGEVEFITRADVDRRAHNRKLARARAEKKRAEAAAIREAELQAQRDKNGGLTDYELKEKRRQEEKEAARGGFRRQAAYFIDVLESKESYFCRSIADAMGEGRLPHGGGIRVVLEIIAKTAGRTNSKAYDAKFDEALAKFEQLKKDWAQ